MYVSCCRCWQSWFSAVGMCAISSQLTSVHMLQWYYHTESYILICGHQCHFCTHLTALRHMGSWTLIQFHAKKITGSRRMDYISTWFLFSLHKFKTSVIRTPLLKCSIIYVNLFNTHIDPYHYMTIMWRV